MSDHPQDAVSPVDPDNVRPHRIDERSDLEGMTQEMAAIPRHR